jgi:hypothetical protein
VATQEQRAYLTGVPARDYNPPMVCVVLLTGGGVLRSAETESKDVRQQDGQTLLAQHNLAKDTLSGADWDAELVRGYF